MYCILQWKRESRYILVQVTIVRHIPETTRVVTIWWILGIFVLKIRENVKLAIVCQMNCPSYLRRAQLCFEVCDEGSINNL